MKNVLISCYHGEVFVKCSKSIKRKKILEAVRGYFQDNLGKPIIGLPNVSYETESQWSKRMASDMDKGKDDIWSLIPTINI
ncbi:hypothetical protein NE686_17710 [Tissierella carlieri]|uniref:Uncharacterized protein n=1 Tax=Tissierella carlieri TaxID=689904 RepID=A0ABT1SEN1_9FIRM|nr:hypothetical protein [Tissierella carlieri]MCQ4924941.1 hypothetical protein [Tissierella carlieri]